MTVLAELLYVISNFEKGRVKSSGIWKRKYVKSLKNSVEIMSLLTNLISENREISQDEISFLQCFIRENNDVIFLDEENLISLFCEKNNLDFSPNEFEDITRLMNDIIFEIKNLLLTKEKCYKTKISYLLRAFHNLPKVFLDLSDEKVFEHEIQPIAKQEAIEYALSYLSLKEKVSE